MLRKSDLRPLLQRLQHSAILGANLGAKTSLALLWPVTATSILLLACQGAVIEGVSGDDGQPGGAAGADNSSGGQASAGAGVEPKGTGGAGMGGAGGILVTTGKGGTNMLGGTAGTSSMGGGVPGIAGMPGTGGVVAPPAGSVQMFVAVGRGGRRITSCDAGRTWIADQMVAPESQDNEHQPYTPKGMAYGNGTFIFLSGWGNPSTTWASTNGVNWSQKKHETGYGGIGFDKGAFILVGDNSLQSIDKGATWTGTNAPEAPHGRENAAFDGIWASGSDGQVSTRRGAGNWVSLSGCTGPRHGGIGTDGGYAAGLGFMVSVGEDGSTCGINIATGVALNSGRIAATIRGKPSFVGDAVMVASGDKLHSTTDGVNWTSRSLPTDVRFDLVARSASGTYAGASSSGDSFYFSDDGQRWTKAKAPAGNGLSYLLAGAGSPSAQCSLP